MQDTPRIILNLGCGLRTSNAPEIVNIDWSLYLQIRQSRALKVLARPFMSPQQAEKLKRVSGEVRVHNLAKGIPFPDDSVDVVYHSHMMEHLDREVAPAFQREVWRVLRPGGIQRIVVPDFEQLCLNYINHVDICKADPEQRGSHDKYVGQILEQSVRREAAASHLQRPARRFLESIVLGDARRRGETHQWMYDRFNLAAIASLAGFVNPTVRTHSTSSIPGWEAYGLDLLSDGSPYKPGSLYLEVQKPGI